MPEPVEALLKEASIAPKTAATHFQCRVFNSPWDQFVEQWATVAYTFVSHALAGYAQEPLPEILPIHDGAHSAGANASFNPANGQICISSVVENRPGITLEKLTHELTHAALNDFPEGDSFYEEGFVDFSVWVMAHAPAWGQFQEEMIKAAAYNIKVRRERAKRDLSDWDRKRWAGGLFASAVHGPYIVARLRQRKMEGDLRW